MKINLFSKFLLSVLVFLFVYSLLEISFTGLVFSYRLYLFKVFLLICLVFMIYSSILAFYAIRIKRPYALRILFGIIVAYLFILLSVLSWLHLIDYTATSIELFLAMIIVFATVLASRYAHVFNSLEKANADLLILDKMKDDFLATTSHELKTPLHGIIGLSQTLIDGSPDLVTPAQKENHELICSEAKHHCCSPEAVKDNYLHFLFDKKL